MPQLAMLALDPQRVSSSAGLFTAIFVVALVIYVVAKASKRRG